MNFNIYFLFGNSKSKSILSLYISKFFSQKKKRTLIIEFEEKKSILYLTDNLVKTEVFFSKELYELEYKSIFSIVDYIKFDKYFFTILDKDNEKIINFFNYIAKHYSNVIVIGNESLFDYLKSFLNGYRIFLIYIDYIRNIDHKINLQYIEDFFLKKFFIFEKFDNKNLKNISLFNSLKKIHSNIIVEDFFNSSIHEDELFFISNIFFNKENMQLVNKLLKKINI